MLWDPFKSLNIETHQNSLCYKKIDYYSNIHQRETHSRNIMNTKAFNGSESSIDVKHEKLITLLVNV